VRKVQETIRQNYGTNYRVELFGSTSYGVDSPASDLDLVIVVRARFHPHSPSSLNFDQDTNRMDGFPPSLDLNSLPRKYILPSMIIRGLNAHVIRKLSTMSGLSQPEPRVLQRTESAHHRNVGRALSKAGFTAVFPIPSASVPIG
jgi:hypothetical protein